MEKIRYFKIACNNSLKGFSGPYNPETANDIIENPNEITGIEFEFIIEDGKIDHDMEKKLLEVGHSTIEARILASSNIKFKSELYFIGKIVSNDAIKKMLGDSNKKYGEYEKFAVSYDEDGDIFDTRPIDNGYDTIYPVSSKSELEEIYYQKTGNRISIAEHPIEKIHK